MTTNKANTYGFHGRWAWMQTTEDDREMLQIPDGYPPYIIFDRGEDDPVLAYADSWYEAETVATALDIADGDN